MRVHLLASVTSCYPSDCGVNKQPSKTGNASHGHGHDGALLSVFTLLPRLTNNRILSHHYLYWPFSRSGGKKSLNTQTFTGRKIWQPRGPKKHEMDP